MGPQSALPPVGARVLAFVAILVGGACGALIGAGVVDVQCDGDCTAPAAIAAVVGAVVGALGVAVVAVLALRAMGEWRTIEHGQSAAREYVNQAEDARGVSLLGRLRGDDRPAPPELGVAEAANPASLTPDSEGEPPEALRGS